jgi:ferredoxin
LHEVLSRCEKRIRCSSCYRRDLEGFHRVQRLEELEREVRGTGKLLCGSKKTLMDVKTRLRLEKGFGSYENVLNALEMLL